MNYKPNNENTSSDNSRKSWNKWINQRSTVFIATRDWYNENINSDYIDLDSHENNRNFFDNLLTKIDTNDFENIMFNMYVYRNKYIFKDLGNTIHGYYTRKNCRNVPSGIYFNILIPVDSNLKSRVLQKDELIYVGKITLGELSDPSIIEEITHQDMRDSNNVQNPSICSNISYNRKRPLSTKQLFTPLYKSEKGAEFGPDATCNKIYSDWTR